MTLQAMPEPEPIPPSAHEVAVATEPTPTPFQPLVQSRAPVKATGLPTPNWLTVTEAAFLTRLPIEQVLEWIERDLVKHHALVRGATEPSAILVRTSDLEEALAGNGHRSKPSSV